MEWIRRPVWSDAVAAAVKEVNRRLAARVSTDPGIRFVDLTGEVLSLDYVDTLYFNPAFYQKIQPRVIAEITALSKPESN